MKFDTKKICETNSLFEWLDRYGIEIDKKGFSCCPFHSEKTASFRVYKDGTFHCFGCGAHGDVITFVMKMQNLSFQDACKVLDRDITYSEQRAIERAKRKAAQKANDRKASTIKYWNAFDRWKHNEDIIELFKPSGPDDVPNALFLNAIEQRALLEHELNLSENLRERSADACRI